MYVRILLACLLAYVFIYLFGFVLVILDSLWYVPPGSLMSRTRTWVQRDHMCDLNRCRLPQKLFTEEVWITPSCNSHSYYLLTPDGEWDVADLVKCTTVYLSHASWGCSWFVQHQSSWTSFIFNERWHKHELERHSWTDWSVRASWSWLINIMPQRNNSKY